MVYRDLTENRRNIHLKWHKYDMREEKEFINGYNKKNIMNVKFILRLFFAYES